MRSTGALLAALFLLQGCSAILPASENYGKRTLGTVWDDQMIESRAKRLIREAHPDLAEAHFGVTSFDGIVLITGQVASPEAKAVATEKVSELRKVKVVHNEMEIAGPTSLLARSNDTWLTTKVKTALLASDKVAGNRIKVVTEDGTVYLMGLLTRDEADNAVEVARQVYGVQKIVKVFEYIN
jgi:osmotically-inducible protein OsmY